MDNTTTDLLTQLVSEKFNIRGDCTRIDKVSFGFNRGYTLTKTKVKFEGVASLQFLCRITANVCVNDIQSIQRLKIPRSIKIWLDKHYVTDNCNRLLSHKFNVRARSGGSKIKMIFCSSKFKSGFDTWHIESCEQKRYDSQHCVCIDLLNDPGCIFDNDGSSQILKWEGDWYFNVMAEKHEKPYRITSDGHLNCCNKLFNECPCFRLTSNPEHFFQCMRSI